MHTHMCDARDKYRRTEGERDQREGRRGQREGGKGGREGRIRVVPERSVIETRQCKATAPEDNSLFLKRKRRTASGRI